MNELPDEPCTSDCRECSDARRCLSPRGALYVKVGYDGPIPPDMLPPWSWLKKPDVEAQS